MYTIKYKGGSINVEPYKTIANNRSTMLFSAFLGGRYKTNCKTLIGAKRWITAQIKQNKEV